MLFISYGCTTDDSKTHATADDAAMARKFNAPSGLISPERAQELNDNWSATRANAIQAAIGKPDNRSVQFTLQDMRDYLDYAENQSQDLGYEMDGVRIYFAAYGEHEANGKAGQATVFLVPTGIKNISEASMIPFTRKEGGDIPGGDGLNMGTNGNPPSANYPQ